MNPPPDIPFNRPFTAGHELDYFQLAVEIGHLSGDGPFSRRCWYNRGETCHTPRKPGSSTA
jgi:dTDP-4-amino-4,6-dideoxygalactose transaminase